MDSMAKIEVECALLNIRLAEKYMKDKELELAAHRIVDARKSLEELEKLIKKAN